MTGELADLAARPAGWSWPKAAGDPEKTSGTLGRLFAAAAAAPEGSAYRQFSRAVVQDPAWNGVLFLNVPVAAAELPSQNNKRTKPPEALKHCNVAGYPGVQAANGVCVRLSGYISAGFNAGQIK